MKLKSLLFMVTLLLCCLGVRAQSKVVFEEHFVAEPSDPSAVGFYEFINFEEGDSHSLDEGSLFLFNSDGTLDENSWWRRAIKFRNLDLKEGKSYRLDFKLRGSNRYEDGTHTGDDRPRCQASAALMQGEDDFDIALMDYSGNEQRATFERFNESDFESYSSTFVFASEELQKEKYAEKGKGELADKFFLTLSVFNPGMFYLQDVVLTEVNTVQSVQYGQYAIQVSYGPNTNIAEMARADEKGLVCFDDLSYATVKAGNEVMEVEAIEYHDDGYLYIFTVDEMPTEGGVVVSFTNPTDDKQIKYNGEIETQASVFDFENEEAKYNEALVGVYSYLYQDPKLKESYPQSGSFAIDKALSEFSFTFDRKVNTTKAKAVLDRDGEEMDLIVKEGQDEFAETVVFVRNDNGLLAKKNTITLTNIISEQNMGESQVYTVSFEAGKPKVAKEIYTPVQTIDFTNDAVNTIPLGWTLVNDFVNGEGEVRESGSSQGSGPRLIKPESFYVRADKADAISTATFGNLEGYAVTLPVGDLRIQFMASGYKNAGQKVLCEVLDATGEKVLASEEHYMVNVTPDGKAVDKENLDKIEVAYKNETEQNAIIRYTVYRVGGMTETMLNSVIVNTYEKTEGDVADDKYLIKETFAAWANSTPAVGSGWEIYDHEVGGKIPGGTNPGKSRILPNGGKPIPQAYFCRVFGGLSDDPADYMTYGAEDGGPKLTLEKGIEYEMTYYAATWNDEGGNSLVRYELYGPNGNVVSSATKKLSAEANAHNNAGTVFDADKFVYKFTPSESGDYVLKFWGSNCTLACGNITFVQPGSRAVRYFAQLDAAVETAKAALKEAEDSKYDGTTKTELSEAIAEYEDQEAITMTTEEEFLAAIAELNALTKAMKTRVEYIKRFGDAVVAAANALVLSEAESKYKKLECYGLLEETYNEYKDVNPSSLEDVELIASTTILEDYSALFANMKSSCVALITTQINKLADMLVGLDLDMENDPYVKAAREAVADDQNIAYQLKLRITRAIYEKCAEGDPFNTPVIDPVSGEQVPGEFMPEEIDATNFIQNANFYSTGGWPATEEDFPGWTIKVISGKIGSTYGTASWGGEPATPTKPYVDAAIKTDWGTHEHDAQQLIDVLPVVKYNVSIIVGEDGGEPHEAYAYLGEGEDQVKVVYDGQTPGEEGNTYSRDTNLPRVFSDVAAKTTEEEWFLGSILLGAHPVVHGGFTRTDNAKLTMIGKVEGFNYLEAAAKITELINGQGVRGDANNDGEVGMPDVMFVVNAILGTPAETFNEKNGDANLDGEIGMPDVMYIVNYILNGKFPDAEE